MNKTQKILLTVTLATTTLLATTACSSDITFNQSELDKVLIQSQEYLESQNNYSTEFARNYLIDSLTKGIDTLDDNFANTTYTTEYKQYDVLGNLLGSHSVIYKNYKNENTIKLYRKYDDQETYGVLKLIKNATEYKYELKVYDVATKKYTTHIYDLKDENNQVTSLVPNLIKNLSINVLDEYVRTYKVVNDNPNINVVMDKYNEGKTTFSLFPQEHEISKLTFDNGLIIGIDSIELPENNNSLKGNTSRKTIIEYNITDFEIDNIDSYTEENQ